jgi:hypothetical protein
MSSFVAGPAVPPVEDHVVAEVELAAHADRRVAARVAGEQVMMEGRILPAPGAAESVVLGVEGFAGDAVLHRDIHGGEFDVAAFGPRLHVAVKRQVFIHAPAGRAMVDDHLALGIAADVVAALPSLGLAAAYAEVPQDDVVRVDIDRGIGQTNAVAGGGLSRDRDVGILDVDVAGELDDARDAEDDDPRALGFDGGAEAARAVVGERGDLNDATAATAGRVHAAAPGAGERRDALGEPRRKRRGLAGLGGVLGTRE